ncbi:D-lactate dehydrogenase 2 [Dimargaris cristalligena]|uniref:D-2-hydroxyglutarate dehydrogenase, mitochondrial n=1 Tax=Dimargaris cristalligena TaxID=215637 RepID=A0A4V1J5L2_9FUNG|nr:D-lactate dehydrogenase 2 [Dimargaris cristalligena]|eukprot:RKP39449.1 D-lactate dehydrogenase 2 [Dimargaris cristalligena]
MHLIRPVQGRPLTTSTPSLLRPTTSQAGPALTSEKYPQLKRNPSFKSLTSEDVSHFRKILSPGSVLSTLATPDAPATEAEELHAYNSDWMGKYLGQSRCILRPKTTEQVSQILQYCHAQRLAVVPQGGNTGLVGGSVPVFDEVVLSLNNMNKIRSFDPISGVLVCDAGCVLESLDNYVAEQDHIMPLDLGAKGSCHIGGNISTNAGGIRYLRYGSLHGSVLGLEVVLPDGTVLENLSTLRKDSTGYDIKQLFIGAEGTLGIVTGVSIVAPPRPKVQTVAVLGVDSYESVQKTFIAAKQNLTEIISAFEFWDRSSMNMVLAHAGTNARDPLADEYPFYVLIETSGFKKEHDDEKFSEFLEMVMEKGFVTDGVLSENASQITMFWYLRETIAEATVKTGPTYKYDVSIPVPQLYNLVLDTRQRLTDMGLYKEGSADYAVKEVTGYGHVGDSNLHLNVVAKEYSPTVSSALEPFIYEWIANHKGSISAEHGLGLMKAPYLCYSKGPSMIQTMQRFKQLMDPHGIMNPYKYLPAAEKSA